MSEERMSLSANGAYAPKLTSWSKEPTLMELKYDWEMSKTSHQARINKIDEWNHLLNVTGSEKIAKRRGRSSVQPKLVRRQAEWRYPALSEPFLGTPNLFKVKPATAEDAKAARQNQLVLNHQFRNKFNRVKFIDDYVRSVVDDGTAIVQVGWDQQIATFKEKVPVYEHFPPESEEELQPLMEAIDLKESNPRGYDETVPDEIKAAVTYYEENGQPSVAVPTGEFELVEIEKPIVNRPTAIVRNPRNVYIDPSCEGDLDKALYICVTFETNKADLLKQGKRYKNLDKVNWDSNSPATDPDHISNTPEAFQLQDRVTKKVVAYEYWGFRDINNNGKLVPIVATWIGNTLIRMEESPFPDNKLPFVVVPYLPIKRELYGEADAELLADNQRINGAVTRGLIDLLARSANGQQGFAKGMLDPLNRKRYESGADYEFNPNLSPQMGLIEHKYPEIPQSAMMMLNLVNQEAEAITGVKSFSGGMSGEAYGDVAAGIKGILDAAAKREMAILRRLAQGIIEIGKKFASMNAVFLSEEETVRITNEQFEVIKREDLAGNFDIIVDIATAEVDNAQSQDLAFMLQTIGPDEDPEIRRMILAEICELKRMPEFAGRIRNYKPEPDPLVVQKNQLEVKKLEKEIEKLQSEIARNNAQAEKSAAEANQTDLETHEQETGIRHDREMDKQRGQAEGNMDLETTKSLLKTRKPDEREGDVEAALGFSEIARNRNNPPAVDQLPIPAFGAAQPDEEFDDPVL